MYNLMSNKTFDSFDITNGPLWCGKFVPNFRKHHINGEKKHQFITLILFFNLAICDAIAGLQFVKIIIINYND